MIVLDKVYDDKGIEIGIIWTTPIDLNKVGFTGKTPLELIREDIANGTDTQGHAKYRKILQSAGILTSQELFSWRQRLSVEEKPVE